MTMAELAHISLVVVTITVNSTVLTSTMIVIVGIVTIRSAMFKATSDVIRFILFVHFLILFF